jgi:transposase-like protein
MTREERLRRRFSEEFRKQQVLLIEKGELTVRDVAQLYEVKPANVKRWLYQYGTTTKPSPILISDGSAYNQVKELKKEVEKLNAIIGKQHVELIYNRELIRQAELDLGIKIKKKL